MTETRPMIRGATLNLGGQDYVVPPLNLRQLEDHAALIDTLNEALAGHDVREQRRIVLILTHAALTRNYPALTLEEVKDLLDLGNLPEVARAVMGESGFVLPGEAPGEERPE